MKTLRMSNKNSNVSLTNRLNDMKEKLSDLEDKKI